MHKKDFCLSVYKGAPKGSPATLDKRWYVEINNPRKLIYISTRLKTIAEREAESMRIIKRVMKSLRKGGKLVINKHRRHVLYKALDLHKAYLGGDGKTYQDYECKVAMILEYLDYKEFKKIRQLDLMNFIQSMTEKGRTNVTINNYMVTLKMLFNEAAKALELRKYVNPWDGIKPLPQTPQSLERFKEAQLPGLLQAIRADKNPQLFTAVQMVYYCFIRPRSELRRLQLKDFHFIEKKIKITSGKAKNKKTSWIAIPDQLLEYLLSKGFDKLPGSYYLIGKHGAPGPEQLGKNTLGDRHMKILRRLGYGEEYGMYSWKHTGVWFCVKAGHNIKELQLQLRHSSLDETSEYLKGLGCQDMPNIQKRFPSLPVGDAAVNVQEDFAARASA